MRILAILFVSAAAAADPDATESNLERLDRMTLEELMQVEVTSVSRRPEKLSETASAIQVITREEIRRSGATTLAEALSLADNLNIARKDSRARAISARGFNTDLANKLLVLIDGRTVYTPLFSGVFWEQQDYLLEDVERIEVISGPGGTLWGANAVNGIINIITRHAADSAGAYAEAGAGSELSTFVGARCGGSLGARASFRVYGKYLERDASVTADGVDVDDAWDMGRAGYRIDAQFSSQDTLTWQGDVYDGDEDLDAGGTAHVDGGNLLGRWSRTLSDEAELSLQLYYDRTHLVMPVPAFVINNIPLAPAGTFQDSLDTYDLELQHRFRVGSRHRLVWGVGYRFTHDVAVNAPALAFLPPVLDQRIYGGFLQDEIQLPRNLVLTLGTKIEHNDYTGYEYGPSVRLLYRPEGDWTLWAAVSRAVRTPSRIDRDLSQPAPPNLVVLAGSPGFDSETVLAHELGYRARFGEKLAVSVATFFNRYDDVRSTAFTPNTIVPLFFENDLEGETYGLELGVTYQALDQWRLQGGYSLLEEDLNVEPGGTDVNGARNETADPEHQLSLRSFLDLGRRFELDGRLRWVDTLHNNMGPQPGTVPSYTELDLRLGWRATDRLELSLVGQDLLHDQHPEYGFPDPARPELERSAHVKAAYRW